MNKGRKFSLVAFAAVAAVVVAGCGSSTASKQSKAAIDSGLCTQTTDTSLSPSFQKTWSALIASAKKEGTLQIVTGTNVKAAEQPVWDCFAKTFGIKVVVTSGSSSDVNSRVLAERTQGRYTVDVSLLGSGGTTTFLKAHAYEPLKPLLIYPDILDRSHWYLKNIPWFDADTQQYVTLYIATLVPNVLNIYYNTDKVTKADLDSITSLQDLLGPKWKGKIVIGDVADGDADREAADAWMKLGQNYFDQLLTNQQVGVVPLAGDRQFTDGIVRGQWEIGFLGEFAISDINAAEQSHLPIANLTKTLKEGPDATIEGQAAIFDHPADPAASQLFVNWLLSKQGQTAYNALLVTSERPGSQSFRNDVPQGAIPDADWNRLHTPGYTLTYDPTAYNTARTAALDYFKQKFTQLHITP